MPLFGKGVSAKNAKGDASCTDEVGLVWLSLACQTLSEH